MQKLQQQQQQQRININKIRMKLQLIYHKLIVKQLVLVDKQVESQIYNIHHHQLHHHQKVQEIMHQMLLVL